MPELAIFIKLFDEPDIDTPFVISVVLKRIGYAVLAKEAVCVVVSKKLPYEPVAVLKPPPPPPPVEVIVT